MANRKVAKLRCGRGIARIDDRGHVPTGRISTAMIQRALLFARPLYTVRNYAVSRANPRPKDPVLTSPNAKVQQIGEVTFIHNPPSSVPTPHSLTTAPASPLLFKAAEGGGELPPLVRQKRKPEQARLTQEQMNELRRLRMSDPKTYTCGVLARKYGCSRVFVSMVAPLPKDKQPERASEEWGEHKMLIREIRRRRREHWCECISVSRDTAHDRFRGWSERLPSR